MPTSAPRPPLTREALAHLLAAAGLTLSPDEVDGLLAPTAAIYQAIDGLDALALTGVEPAAVCYLPAPVRSPDAGSGPPSRPPVAGGSAPARSLDARRDAAALPPRGWTDAGAPAGLPSGAGAQP